MPAAPAIAIALAIAAIPQQDALRRVAPGYEDWSPVALSQRFEPVDNRATLFFEDVYEAERPGPYGRPAERVYLRLHGGVVAVFPQSSYVETEWGVEAEVPPGTVFHLGTAAEALGGAMPVATAPRPGQVSFREDLSAAADRPAVALAAAQRRSVATTEAPEPPSIFTSEAYRQRRMATLLAEAARVEMGQ
jgi:hypothetical protein